MGDIETLLEKIQETAEPEEIESEQMQKIMKGKLNLKDFYDQLERVSEMGSLDKILQMIPGVGMSVPQEEMEVGKEKLERFKLIMQSMTEEELEDPQILNSSRIDRIVEGSDTSKKEVKELLEQHQKMKKMLKSFTKGRQPKAGNLRKFFKQMPDDLK